MKLGRRIRAVAGKSIYWPVLRRRIRSKWYRDCESLPLTPDHHELYERIHALYWMRMGHFPDLVAGESFNEKIHWMKLFSQDQRVIRRTDKLQFKEHVMATVGGNHVPETLAVAARYSELDFRALPGSLIIKTNHDSGSAMIIRDHDGSPDARHREHFDRAMGRVYGAQGGEWQYWTIEPRVFAEELLPFADGKPPPDYKFHCANGRVLWQQFISGRGGPMKEAITDRDGRVLGIHLDQKMTQTTHFLRPENWEEMVSIAERLAEDFPYARVDLYNVDGRVLVGEMTFSPSNGLYRSEGNQVLGRMLLLDRSVIRDPVCTRFPEGGR